jgi:hypothetical protein
MSRRGLRGAPKLIGAGFAKPNKNGERRNSSTAGSKIVPIGSMCLSGLKLTLSL